MAHICGAGRTARLQPLFMVGRAVGRQGRLERQVDGFADVLRIVSMSAVYPHLRRGERLKQ
jgi:hypothetical protein